MFGNPSLVTRIAIGKGIGLLFGLLGFVLLPYFDPNSGLLLRWGILLWYPTLGAVIGLVGVVTFHPVLKLSMPWWVRGPFIGAWMNFVLTFFAYDAMKALLETMFSPDGPMTSPFWFALEGAVVGLIIDYFATRYGGEGKAAVEGDERPAS